jgi:two-component system chemotaxis sensor kinase CheA
MLNHGKNKAKAIWQKLKDLRLRTKLMICFFVIMTINSTVGALNVSVIRGLGELVNRTYDKALMSGTFAQSAKFDFAKVDSETNSALLAKDLESFKTHLEEADRYQDTLTEDLQVVEERALSPRSGKLVGDIREELAKLQPLRAKLAEEKKKALANRQDRESSAIGSLWSADKSRAKIESLLTTLYDDAAETGYRFRLDSEKTNQRNFKLTLCAVAIGFLLSLALSLALSFSLLRPVGILIDACRRIQAGDYSMRSKIARQDEFGSLSESFDSMLTRIEQKDKDISSLLTALPFGLFYFDRLGKISVERSQATDLIFSDFQGFATIEDFLEKYRNLDRVKSSEIRHVIMDEMIPFEAAAGILPDRLELRINGNEKFVNLSYRDQRDSRDKIDRVIVIAEDVTARIMAEKKNEYDEERVRRISYASRNLESYRYFRSDALTLFDQSHELLRQDRSSSYLELKRALHSVKGLISVFQFRHLAKQVHEVETLVVEDRLIENVAELERKIETLKNEFSAQCLEISEILGLKEDDLFKRVDARKIKAIQAVALKIENQEMSGLVQSLDRFPVSMVMGKYAQYCQTVCENLNDRSAEVRFESDSDEVTYEEVLHLDPILSHLFRNSIDHGVETIEERSALGKTEAGVISVRCKRQSRHDIEIVISDDGRGIDVNRLAHKAIDAGLWTTSQAEMATYEQKMDLIFSSGLSTKEQTSELSGRGVGMDAVRHYLHSIGGSIQVESILGKGTTFILTSPIPSQAQAKKESHEAA